MASRFENETVHFGKHKGRTFGEIAQDHVLYLDWLVGQKWFESRFPEKFHRLSAFLKRSGNRAKPPLGARRVGGVLELIPTNYFFAADRSKGLHDGRSNLRCETMNGSVREKEVNHSLMR